MESLFGGKGGVKKQRKSEENGADYLETKISMLCFCPSSGVAHREYSSQ